MTDLAASQTNDQAGARKPLVMIGICTRMRDKKLARLLKSLSVQPQPANWDIAITIVDNNDHPTAQAVVDAIALPFDISVHHQPQPGLVFARNMTLDIAQAAKADWFIGIDDDEWVAPDWLANFTAAFDHPQGFKMFMGPCTLVFAPLASSYLQKNPPKRVPFGTRPKSMNTQNFAIHRTVFATDAAGLRFHPAFNETGGEDLEFFRRAARAHGFQASAVPDAIVFEDRNGARATLRYRLFRTLRNQLSDLRIDRLHRQQGLHGSRLANALDLILLTNRCVVFAMLNAIAALIRLPFDRPRAKILIGIALQWSARLIAVGRFLTGRIPKAYGAAAPPN